MAGCGILDIECIFINEIFGSVLLTAIAGAIIYLIVMQKLNFRFEVTIALLIPVSILFGMMIGGFQVIYGFVTIIVAIMVADVFQRIIGNR